MPSIQLIAPVPVAASGLLEDLQLAGLAVSDVVPVVGSSDNGVVIHGTFIASDVDEIVAVVQAHDGLPSDDEATDIDANQNIEAAIMKARAVWKDTDTYTNAEAQKTVAGLVLYVTNKHPN
jgi:hypothetical protein